ncbi:MAG: usg protein [Alphaproteobacteria bacterium]|nr:usg protein [Alphaproteobacteria bacterium]
MATSDFQRALEGYSLTTAEILYRMPDHRSLIQTYVWQDYDLHPRFPKLRDFLDFWEAHLEGPLYKVTVCHRELISPSEVRLIDGDYRLN